MKNKANFTYQDYQASMQMFKNYEKASDLDKADIEDRLKKMEIKLDKAVGQLSSKITA